MLKRFKRLFFSSALVLIIVLAVFLRLYKLDQIPAGLHQDEVALGYNSFSLLRTGTDEHGKFLPLALESFGDWKLPVYPLVTIPFINILGLTEIAVRLPSVLAGIASVLLIYLLVVELFKKKSIGLFAALFISLSPWSIFFSRTAAEFNLGTTFVIFALLLLVRYLHHVGNPKELLISSFLFGLTLFTYHSFVVFTPLFVLVLFIFYKNNFKETRILVLSLIIFGFFSIASFWSTMNGGIGKLPQVSILNDPLFIYRRMAPRGDNTNESPLLKQFLYNKVSSGVYEIGQNYLLSFSPTFLFDAGGQKLITTMGYFGYFYIFDALLIFIGFLSMFWKREKEAKLLIIWLLVSPIPSAITRNSPSTTRIFVMFPVLTIIASYGAYFLWQYFKNKSPFLSILKYALVATFFLNCFYFAEFYFVHLNILRGEFLHFGYKEVVGITKQYPNYNIVMRGPNNFPYVYFLYYTRYDPKKFQKEVEYYPRTEEGFLLVKSFSRYTFVEAIDYKHLKTKTLYVDLEPPKHFGYETIDLPSGKPIFWYFVPEEAVNK